MNVSESISVLLIRELIPFVGRLLNDVYEHLKPRIFRKRFKA
jgi:hypothetical protein